MIGHFSRRGKPTTLDRWAKTDCAIQAGTDMVLELLFALATSKTESYARVGTFLLKSLGVQYLSFGSESPDLKSYLDLARRIMKAKEDLDFQGLLKQVSLPRTLQTWVNLPKEEQAIPQGPSDILALEYCQATFNFELDLNLLPIPRLHQDNPYKIPTHLVSRLREWVQSQDQEKGI